MVDLIDARAMQDVADGRTLVRKGKTFQRDPSTIDGIVLHQTGVNYGNWPRERLVRRVIKGAGSSPGVPAHAIAMNGFFVQAFDLTAYCYHANTLNGPTLGLEIEGRLPGLESARTKAHTVLTPARIDAAQAALVFLLEEGRKLGMPLKYLYAHRQSSKDRQADPGEALWKLLEPVAMEHGLFVRPKWTIGGGRPIPAAWSELGDAEY